MTQEGVSSGVVPEEPKGATSVGITVMVISHLPPVEERTECSRTERSVSWRVDGNKGRGGSESRVQRRTWMRGEFQRFRLVRGRQAWQRISNKVCPNTLLTNGSCEWVHGISRNLLSFQQGLCAKHQSCTRSARGVHESTGLHAKCQRCARRHGADVNSCQGRRKVGQSR